LPYKKVRDKYKKQLELKLKGKIKIFSSFDLNLERKILKKMYKRKVE
jgi:hypothetical protein